MSNQYGGMRGPIIGPGYYSGFRHQRGGGFWSKALSAAIIPALKFIGKKAAGTAADVLTDVSDGQNVKEAIQNRVQEQGKKLVSTAAGRALRFAQTGKGRRKMKGGKRKLKGGKRKLKGGKRKLKGGKRKQRGGMKGGKRRVVRMKGGKRSIRGGRRMKGKGFKKIGNKSKRIPHFLK